MLLAGLALLAVAVAWLALGGVRTTRSVKPAPSAPAAPQAEAPLAGELVEATPPSGSSREPTADEPEGLELEVDAHGSEPGARLVVLAVAAETRAPLAGIRMTLMPPTGGSAEHVQDTRGSLERSPVTAEEGRVEFELPAGLELSLRGWGASAFAGSAQLAIEPMAPGEERTVELALPTGLDLVYHGRVLAASDRRPVADARVEVEREGFRTGTVTGPDGSFELELPSWSQVDLWIRAPGYATVLLEPGRGHEGPETARVVLLARTASLRARVLDAAGAPVPDVLVRLSTHAYHLAIPHHGGVYVPSYSNLDWSARTDGSGACELEDLPPSVPLAVELVADGHPPKKDLPPLSLVPGELQEVEWRLGSGCRIQGRVVDERDQPVAGQALWLQRASIEAPKFFRPHEEPAQTARSDAHGQFRMDDVAPGTWWLGPAAEREADPPAVAPAAALVEIASDELVKPVLVRVHRGLLLRGSVLRPDGSPAARALVLATGVEAGWGPDASTGADGAFVLGPLVPGRYVLRAMDGQSADSEPLEASAGEEGVVLRLRLGGSLRGTVRDGATDRASEASLAYARVGGDGSWFLGETKEDGSFLLERLLPGTYDLAARASGMRCGLLREVVVVAGAETGPLELLLEPGAHLRVRYAGAQDHVQYQVRFEGAIVAGDGVPAGSVAETAVPAGRIVVETFRGRGARLQTELELAPGEERELVVTD